MIRILERIRDFFGDEIVYTVERKSNPPPDRAADRCATEESKREEKLDETMNFRQKKAKETL